MGAGEALRPTSSTHSDELFPPKSCELEDSALGTLARGHRGLAAFLLLYVASGSERSKLSADQLAAHGALLLVVGEERLQIVRMNWASLQPLDDPLVDDLGPVGFELGGFLGGSSIGQRVNVSLTAASYTFSRSTLLGALGVVPAGLADLVAKAGTLALGNEVLATLVAVAGHAAAA
jgi:hypothetical protein